MRPPPLKNPAVLYYNSRITRKKLTHKVYQYTAVFEPAEERGGFTVTIPSLPGCISEGETFEEALENIKEAASLYLEDIKEEEKDIYREGKSIIVAPIEVKVWKIHG